jgi:hypothetical protein
MSKGQSKEKRQYKKGDDLLEVQKWCALYPWYAQLVEDIHATLAARDSHSGDYRFVTRPRSNKSNAA